MAIHIRRREFIITLGSAAAWPLAARAQQPVLPVVGFLHSGSAGQFSYLLKGLRRGASNSATAAICCSRNLPVAPRLSQHFGGGNRPLGAEIGA
jgi:hypothetical protein